ncbi:MAG: lysostaphin resistance A-like protein [Thiolinea sp.]
MQKNPLDEVQSRLVLLVCTGVFLGLGIMVSMLLDIDNLKNAGEGTLFALDNYLGILSYLMIAALLWQISTEQRDELAELLFNLPNTQTLKSYFRLSVGIVILSIGLTYLLFYPLSLFIPEWVQGRLLEAPYLFYWDENGWYLPGNLAGFILAVVLAPVIEEFLFRAYLLNRWTLKMGAAPAILLSASLFAILHPDILSAFVFAVLMSLLYLKTRSLVAPILVHASNNLIAVTLEWLDHRYWTGFETVTIADFQAYLWLGIICLLIGGSWIWHYSRKHLMPLNHLLAEHEKGSPDKLRL